MADRSRIQKSVPTVHTLVFTTIDKEFNHVKYILPTMQHESNSANSLKRKTKTIESTIFKHSGFKWKLMEEHDQRDFYDYSHAHTAATTECHTAGYIGVNEYDLMGPLINDFTATIVRLFHTSRTKYSRIPLHSRNTKTNSQHGLLAH